ncbi:MAG: LuxR C-terminal-related transcriptional regulator [Muribaculaceae bacterium]|nr:LuxR C-terminal-related transcriptional regulator [Muribaculaceae bacterium]
MNRILIFIIVATLAIVSCTRHTSRYNKELDEAEKMIEVNSDSALTLLDAIDLSDIDADSLRAKYVYLKAYGHIKGNRSMIADSLISFAHHYYSGKDIVKDIRTGASYAMYKFWVGDTDGSLALLDSLIALPDVPDSLMRITLRIRAFLGASEYQGRELIPVARKLLDMEPDTMRKIEAHYLLLTGYEYAGETDSALYLTDQLIDYARSHNWGDKHFQFELERAQLLTEAGRNEESDRVIDDIFRKAGPENGAADYLHFQYAMNALNRGDVNRAARHLAIADSLALKLRKDDDAYFRSYSNLLHAMIDFKRDGRVRLMHINGLNNRQNERFNRMKASQWESERGALRQEALALAHKAESRKKTVIILLIGIVALLIAAGAAWFIIMRRQRDRENEERIEALRKMVEEYKSAPGAEESPRRESPALRTAMLRQLGIIKMVAETPTEQNREMLMKISSLNGETNGELVDWKNVFEIIDSLYSGFYSRMHERYGEVLSLKEEQIISLIVAGFSTKEISVVTGQSTSSIYVRKTSIRKKLGVPEKEDIVEFLRNTERL